MRSARLAGRCAAGLAASVMVLGSAVTAQAASQASAPRIEISGIYYNSPGSDRGSNASLNDEWVALRNTTGRAIDLTGWKLRDKAGHVFKFGSFTLKAHARVKIHTGHGRGTRLNRYWNRSWYIWNNNGDTAILRTARGTFDDRCSYSDPREEHHYTRC